MSLNLLRIKMPEHARLTMGERPSVLIIEAQQSTRTLLEMILFCEGMRVFSAVSISSALLQLRVLKPDLIILGEDAHAHVPDAVARLEAVCPAPLLLLSDGYGPSGTDPLSERPFSAGLFSARVAEFLKRPCGPTDILGADVL